MKVGLFVEHSTSEPDATYKLVDMVYWPDLMSDLDEYGRDEGGVAVAQIKGKPAVFGKITDMLVAVTAYGITIEHEAHCWEIVD